MSDKHKFCFLPFYLIKCLRDPWDFDKNRLVAACGRDKHIIIIAFNCDKSIPVPH